MTPLTQANAQWSRRPADERFASIAAMDRAARACAHADDDHDACGEKREEEIHRKNPSHSVVGFIFRFLLAIGIYFRYANNHRDPGATTPQQEKRK